MKKQQYDIIFTGDIREGFLLDHVKSKAAQLFKLNEQKCQQLFQQKPVALKSNLDQATALKYQKILTQIGMVVLVQAKSDLNNQDNTSSLSVPSSAPNDDLSDSSNWTIDAPGTLLSPQKAPVSATLPDSQLTIAPQQGNILRSDELAPAAVPEIDFTLLDAIEISTLGDDLLSANEAAIRPSVIVDVSHLSVQEAGADLLNDNEKASVPKVNIDTSQLSLE